MKPRLVELLGTAVILTFALVIDLWDLPKPPALPASPRSTVAMEFVAQEQPEKSQERFPMPVPVPLPGPRGPFWSEPTCWCQARPVPPARWVPPATSLPTYVPPPARPLPVPPRPRTMLAGSK